MKVFRVSPVTILSCALFFLAAPCAHAQQPDVVGAMGNQQVRSADLKRLIDALPADARKRLATDLGALDRLVREELVRQSIIGEARQQGWDKKPDVQLLMERAREIESRLRIDE